jgi:hypothetical protein
MPAEEFDMCFSSFPPLIVVLAGLENSESKITQ